MKKPVRLLILIICLGVLLIAAFTLGVNLYVQSVGMQNRIRESLSKVAGLPVSLFRTTFSPWGGFRLDQIKVASSQTASGLDLLQAERLEVRCEWIPLLRGQIVFKRIALDSPVFVFQQSTAKRPPLILAQPAATPAPAPAPSTAAPLPRDAPRTPSRPIAQATPSAPPDIRKLLLRDGTFRFLAQDGTEIFRLEGVRCSLTASGKVGEFVGGIEIVKAVVLGQFVITELASPITLIGKKLNAEKVQGVLAGGGIDGALDADFSGSGVPYNVRLRLIKAQLSQFFPADSSLAKQFSGLVHTKIELSGFRGKNHGHAEFKVSHGKISHLPYFETLEQLVHGGDWDNLNIRKAEFKGDIVDSALEITPSTIATDHMEVTVSGSVDRKQKLDLQSTLKVDDSLFKKLPSEARDNFLSISDEKNHSLDFVVNGTLNSPKSNFLDRFIGDRLKKRVQQFLHSFVSDPENPAPTPSPTP